eukprot:10864006-Alexandrium_andersonii.AAC.1
MFSVLISSRATCAASTSRRSHQQPATMSSLRPVGPPRAQGSKPFGSSSARAKGCLLYTSPSPRD